MKAQPTRVKGAKRGTCAARRPPRMLYGHVTEV
jgi:hypothetical protein